MDKMRVIQLLEYIQTFDEHKSGATKIAIDEAIKTIGENMKIKEDLKYYLDNNEFKGIVYIPKFIIEKMVSDK